MYIILSVINNSNQQQHFVHKVGGQLQINKKYKPVENKWHHKSIAHYKTVFHDSVFLQSQFHVSNVPYISKESKKRCWKLFWEAICDCLAGVELNPWVHKAEF